MFLCCLSFTESVASERTIKMDLNLRKAGNRLLKASKEASLSIKAGSDATIAGLKVGTEAAIASYNSANKSISKTTGMVHSRNIERESEVHQGGNWHQEQGKSVSLDTGMEPLQLKLDTAGGREREAGIRHQTGENRCTSAPCQGLTEFLKYSLKCHLHENLVMTN